MGFIQIIELSTSDYEEIERLHEQWLAATEGQRSVISERICADRDNPGTYVMIVEFASYEDAMRNNDLPATADIGAGMTAVSDTPPAFRNLDVLRRD